MMLAGCPDHLVETSGLRPERCINRVRPGFRQKFGATVKTAGRITLVRHRWQCSIATVVCAFFSCVRSSSTSVVVLVGCAPGCGPRVRCRAAIRPAHTSAGPARGSNVFSTVSSAPGAKGRQWAGPRVILSTRVVPVPGGGLGWPAIGAPTTVGSVGLMLPGRQTLWISDSGRVRRSLRIAGPQGMWGAVPRPKLPPTPAGADSDSVAAMPRSVDFSIESPASVEQIHSAFSEEDYWLARLAAFGGIGKLDSFITGTDGSVTVVVIQDARHERMPGLVAKFYPCAVASRAERDVESDRRRPGARGDQHRVARSAGIRVRHGFAGTGAERFAPEVHRDRGVQSPIGRRQDREPNRPPVGQTVLGSTALYREVDHGACLTPVVLRVTHPRRGRRGRPDMPKPASINRGKTALKWG